MKPVHFIGNIFRLLLAGTLQLPLVACRGGPDDLLFDGTTSRANGNARTNGETNASAIFLIIGEESIDNGNKPNNFSETQVNDQLADIGLHRQLRFFEENQGQVIDFFTGQVGDEGWHALKTIPGSWIPTGLPASYPDFELQ